MATDSLHRGNRNSVTVLPRKTGTADRTVKYQRLEQRTGDWGCRDENDR